MMVESLTPCVVSSLREILNSRSEFMAYEFAGAPADDIAAALLIVDFVNQPTPREITVMAVTTMKLRCGSKNQTREDLEASLTIMVSDLGQYPPDAVVCACRTCAEECRWFPAWADVLDILLPMVRRRRAMKKVLEQAAA